MGCFSMIIGRKKRPVQILRKYHAIGETAPCKLPEPETSSASLRSASPSFRAGNNVLHRTRGMINCRIRSFPVPSSLHMHDGDPLISMVEEEEGGESKIQHPTGRDRSSNTEPLPLPSPQSCSVSFAQGRRSSKSTSFDSVPLPLPPSTPVRLRNFAFDEIAAACEDFSIDRRVSEGSSSVIYEASFGDDTSGKTFEATVLRILHSIQCFKNFIGRVVIIASLRHPQLCKLIGFHAHHGSNEQMLVFEKLHHGSLSRLLHGRSGATLVDWRARVKVALCAARGLAFLHDEGPFQGMYSDFSAANVQVDRYFNAKLSEYGCIGSSLEKDYIDESLVNKTFLEMSELGFLTPKSNVWSFGVFILELLMGKRNMEPFFPREEIKLLQWCKQYLTGDLRLSSIMDPSLKGLFPLDAARAVACIALKCLQAEPSERPTMRAVVQFLEHVQAMGHWSRPTDQKPSLLEKKQIRRSTSLNRGIASQIPGLSFSPRPPKRSQTLVLMSPSRVAISLPNGSSVDD